MAGGIFIIASILAMLVFLVVEVFPLWRPPRIARVATPLSLPPERSSRLPVIGSNEYGEILFAIDEGGSAVFWDGQRAAVLETAIVDSLGGRRIRAAEPLDEEGKMWLLATEAGHLVPVTFEDGLEYRTDARVYSPRLEAGHVLTLPMGEPVRLLAVVATDDGFTAATVRGDLGVSISRREVDDSFLSAGATRDTTFAIPFPSVGATPTAVALDAGAAHLYLGTDAGQLLEWDLSSPDRLAGAYTAFAGSPITCLGTLIGGNSLVVGGATGEVQVWFRAAGSRGQVQLLRAIELAPHGAAVAGLAASPRNRTFVSWDETGHAALRIATTGSTRKEIRLEQGRPDRVIFSPKGDALLVSSHSTFARWKLDDPHPEATWKALFGPVHYEGYAKPGYVWQSTGGSDEAEPKLSLIPLVFGTLKGTLYAMCFSAPIAILAALYTAVFMRRGLRQVIKPMMEVLATLPSVVLGLLGGLWLAPRLNTAMPIVLFTLFFLAGVVLLVAWPYRFLQAHTRWRLKTGTEVVLLVPALALGLGLLLQANGWANSLFPDGFLDWLYQRFDVRYDQRNAIVVGIAVGLAVIPLVFSVSEDALSSVPRHLTAGSLALGATMWQTAWRVLLPAASPGIFSALMIGFGRAVGETMIMLMATGNTPIMDWSPFNGFRALSANIATEIPEAPQSGTLYRILFLSALLLFAFTLLVNTTAEIVRGSLRKRYSRF